MMAAANVRGEYSIGYQILLISLLSVNFAILFFDRNAINFLMPFIKPELRLSHFQVGMLASGLSVTWAIAGYLVGSYSDRSGRRVAVIACATLLFSICSFWSGIAASFATLLAARLMMGFAEGGVLPVSQALTASQVAPAHRGLAMGLIQNFCSNLLAATIAPIVLVSLAMTYGWRTAFFLAGVPGIIAAALIWIYLKDPAPTGMQQFRRLSLREAYCVGNIRWCAIIAVSMIAYLMIGWAFLPLYLVQVRGLSTTTMSWLMAALGAMATIGSFAIPAASDRFGRKPVMIIVPLLGVLLPLAAQYFTGPVWALACLFALGWTINGTFSLFLATIPAETVPPAHAATALGVILGTGELIGGGAGPFLAGALADRAGLDAPLWAMIALCLCASLAATRLLETAPRLKVA